jgi:hypothetical protein
LISAVSSKIQSVFLMKGLQAKSSICFSPSLQALVNNPGNPVLQQLVFMDVESDIAGFPQGQALRGLETQSIIQDSIKLRIAHPVDLGTERLAWPEFEEG